VSRLPLVVGAALRNAFTPASSFRIVVAFAMSALVTLAVAGPLAVQAQNADDADDQLAAVIEEEIANGPIGAAREQAELDRAEASGSADAPDSGDSGGFDGAEGSDDADGASADDADDADDADGEIAAGFPGEAGAPVTAPLGAGGVDVVELPTTTEPGAVKDPVIGPRAGESSTANGASENAGTPDDVGGEGDGAAAGPDASGDTGQTGDASTSGDGTGEPLDPNTVANGDSGDNGTDGAGSDGSTTGDSGDTSSGTDSPDGDTDTPDGENPDGNTGNGTTPTSAVDPDPDPTATIPTTSEPTTTTEPDEPPVIGPVQVRLASGAVPLPLDGATLSGEVIISPQLDDGVSVVFTLDGVELTSGRSLVLDTSALEPGEHQLLVTAESPGGLVSDRIATFVTEVHTEPVDPTDPVGEGPGPSGDPAAPSATRNP
jgi:hypothetical protein